MRAPYERQKTDQSDIYDAEPELETHQLDQVIHGFDYLSWGAMGALFHSLWQIAIPHIWVGQGPELATGRYQIIFFIFSLIILFWADKNYRKHKEKESLIKLQHKKEEEARKQGDWNIFFYDFGKYVFVISILLMIIFSTINVSNSLYFDYYASFQEAIQGSITEAFNMKVTRVISMVQTVALIGNCLVLIYYAQSVYYLVMKTYDMAYMLGVFLTLMGSALTMLLVIGKYEGFYSKEILYFKGQFNIDGGVAFLTWISYFVLGLILIYILYNYKNTHSTKPKSNRYLVFGFIFFIISGIIFANALIIMTDIQNFKNSSKFDCQNDLQLFHRDFVHKAGCPFKYLQEHFEGHKIYSQSCGGDEIGLVWEDDLNITVDKKKNMKSCINMNCCKLIKEHHFLGYYNFIIVSIAAMSFSIVIFAMSIILGLRSDPRELCTGEKVYPRLHLIIQYVCFLILLVLYFYSNQMRDRLSPAIPVKSPEVSMFETREFEFDNQPTNKENDIQFQRDDMQTQYGCESAAKYLESPIELKQNIDRQFCGMGCFIKGWIVCLHGDQGIFSVSTYYNDELIRIHDYPHFELARLNINLQNNSFREDNICFNGESNSIMTFLNDDLYFCSNGKTQNMDRQGRVKLVGKKPILIQFPMNLWEADKLKEEEERKKMAIEAEKKKEKEKEAEQNQQKKKGLLLDKLTNLRKNSLENKKAAIHHNQQAHQLNDSNFQPDALNTEVPLDPLHFSVEDYQLDNRAWFSIQLYIFDAELGHLIENAEVRVFSELTLCGIEDPLKTKPIRMKLSDKKGFVYINNLLIGQDYTIHIRADGYLYNCHDLKKDKIQGLYFYYSRVGVVSTFQEDETMKVMLEWSNTLLDIHLGATFNYDTKTMCQVGYFFNKCGGMFTNDQIEIPTDVIIISKLQQTDYLFYVEHLGENKEIRNLAQLSRVQIQANETEMISKANWLFDRERPVIKMFLKERIFPMETWTMPELQDDDVEERHAFWLALCIDGKKGQTKTVALNTFWKRKSGSAQTYIDRAIDDQRNLPGALICTEYFKLHSEEEEESEVTQDL